jgi:ABC-2 type transport system ATP-binding protein
VLLSTHILPEVTLICQRIAIINHGRILAVGSPQGLQRAAEETSSVTVEAKGDEHALKAALLATDGVTDVIIRPLASRPGLFGAECVVDADDTVEARIARAVTGCAELYKLERRQPTLENVFLRYIGHAGQTVAPLEAA